MLDQLIQIVLFAVGAIGGVCLIIFAVGLAYSIGCRIIDWIT